MTIGIYKIENCSNKKIYIGKSTNIEYRFKDHKWSYDKKSEWNKPLYRAFRKYGLNNFNFSIIEECTEEELDDREKYWINFYNSFNDGYNCTNGGDGGKTIEDYRAKFGKLTKEEVIFIRTKYAEGIYPSSYIYEKYYKDKITKRGFQAIWLGTNSKDIMPEVYTDENKKRSLWLGRQWEGIQRRRLSLKEIYTLREREKTESLYNIWKTEYQHLYKSYAGFSDAVRNHHYDEEVDLNVE